MFYFLFCVIIFVLSGYFTYLTFRIDEYQEKTTSVEPCVEVERTGKSNFYRILCRNERILTQGSTEITCI
jgi:cell division protein FtsL